MKVDIVYRWVSPDVVREGDARRFRDNRELAYSIKSLKYAPYINNIYVIAKGCTKWENAPDNLKWINEEEYEDVFTKDEENEEGENDSGHFHLLPNESERSKYIIPLLPDLSEFFILMDDDYYFAKETPFDYFFEENPDSGEFIPIWPEKVLLSHCPIPMTKTLYTECVEKLYIEPVTQKGSAQKDEPQGAYCGILDGDTLYTNKKVVQKRFKFDPLICMQQYLLANNKLVTKQLNHTLIWGRNFRSYKKIFAKLLTDERTNTFSINDNWAINEEAYKTQMLEYDRFRNTLLELV